MAIARGNEEEGIDRDHDAVEPDSCSMPTSTNCKGVIRKKTKNSVRWSPGRVGVSVMNSRKAQNEIRPNSTTVAAGR